ncbi:uncharacterized protein EV420DRAFT_1649471 [Desarmillaria tabescens]|uniref:Uncharacterized protein n=1 Tax=Armillaria tabescens TaxID=1929756 RepID=A0AA39JHV5_ARMTA|nr:uncharacterized protein EV420DRAFT_1649471 [Desarmillaria tabescens]KAK0443047.1 hypothetical protein EV420DRAFT_1649471 [Desarmillaria tabescens]
MNPTSATITHILETLTSLVRYPSYRKARPYPQDGSTPVHPIAGGDHLQTQYSGNSQFTTGYWEDISGSWDDPNTSVTTDVQQFYTDEYSRLISVRTLEKDDGNAANKAEWRGTTFEGINNPFLLTQGVGQKGGCTTVGRTDTGGHRRDEPPGLTRNAGPMLQASELGGGIHSPTEISREAWGVHTGPSTSSWEQSLKGEVSRWSPGTDSSYKMEVIRFESEVASKRSDYLCSQVYQWYHQVALRLACRIHQLARKERGVAEEKGILDRGSLIPVDSWITPEEGSWDLPLMSSDSTASDTWHSTAGDGWESPWPDTSYEAIWPNPMARTHINENLWDSLSTPLFVGEEYRTVPETEKGSNTLTNTSSDNDETIRIFGAEFQH